MILLFILAFILPSDAKMVRLTQSYCERLIEKNEGAVKYHVGSMKNPVPADLNPTFNMASGGSIAIGGSMGSNTPGISIQAGSPNLGAASATPVSTNTGVSTRMVGNNNTMTLGGTATAGTGGAGTGGAGGAGAAGGAGGAGGVGVPGGAGAGGAGGAGGSSTGGAGAAGTGGAGGAAAVSGGSAASDGGVAASLGGVAAGTGVAVGQGGTAGTNGSIVAAPGGAAVSITQNGVNSSGPSGFIGMTPNAPSAQPTQPASTKDIIPIMDDEDKDAILEKCKELY